MPAGVPQSRAREVDLRGVAGAAVLLGALGVLRVPGAAVASVVIAALPGYPLALAAFPRRRSLGPLERAGLVLLASLALVPLEVAIAQRAPGRLDARSFGVVVGTLTLALAALASWRRARVPGGERASSRDWVEDARAAHVAARRVRPAPLVAVGVGLLVLAGVALAVVPTWAPDSSFAELLLLPADGSLSHVTTNATPGATLDLMAVVISHHPNVLRIDLVVTAARGPPATSHDAFSPLAETVTHVELAVPAGANASAPLHVPLPDVGTWLVRVDAAAPGQAALSGHVWVEVRP